ncbi:exopolysaccharide transport family protein [Candidatus Magnetominusculus dajiuhuensis]|uniref:exopolysaccharide transport family protein n=1 Tax=Candidatus Magnetominusculus dajiuhuensis TaxID=3137712 RepID=UPI003B432D41
MELLRYMEIFNRRKRIFYYIIGASLVLALLILLFVRPTYRAAAKVLVLKTPSANGLLAGWGMASQVASTSDDIKTDVELSRVKPLAEAIIGEFKLVGLFGKQLKAEDFFEPSIAENLFSLPYAVVKQYKEVTIIEVSAVTNDPELSASIANKLSANYVESARQRVRDDFKSVRESLELRLDSIRDSYFKTLAISTDMKLRDMTVDLQGETTNAIKAIYTLKTEAEAMDKEYAQFDAEITKGMKQLKELSIYRKEAFEISTNPRLESLKSSLDKKVLDLASLKLDFTKEHPRYKILNEEIDTIKKQMVAEVGLVLSRETMSLNPEYSELSKKILTNRINKEAILAKKAVIQKFIKLDEEELIKIPHKYEASARIEPLLTAQREMYSKIGQYVIQVGLVESISLSKLKIVEPATTPKKRFYPRRGRTLIVAVFLGFFIGLAAVFFVEYMDNTVKSKDDITAFSKLLGRIPLSEHLRNYDAVSALSADSKEIEAINEIKDNIFYETPTNGGGSMALIVTSPGKGDGKTCAAALMGIAYAREGQGVLLVCAGRATSGYSAAAFFGITPDSSNLPMPTGEHGLDVLFEPDIARVNERVGSLREQYGQVIIDTASPKDCAALDGNVICIAEPCKYEKDTLDRVRGVTKGNFVGYVFNKTLQAPIYLIKRLISAS